MLFFSGARPGFAWGPARAELAWPSWQRKASGPPPPLPAEMLSGEHCGWIWPSRALPCPLHRAQQLPRSHWRTCSCPPPAALCDRREQVSCRDYRRQRAVKGWGLRSSGYARTPQSPLHMLCMPRSRCCSCSPLCPPPLMYHPPMTDAMSVALSQVLRVNLVISTILYKQGRGLGNVSRYLTRPCPDSPPPLLDVSTYEHAWASSLPRRRVWWGRGAP